MINADVTIIGGGPAGAIAGKILAQRGYEVVILEKSTFPRYKVCGCCLNEKAVKLLLPNSLQEKDYFPPYIQQKKIDFLYQGKKHSIDLPGGIIISRSDLDTFLINNAKEAGCKVFQGVKARLNMFSLNVEGQNVPQLKSKIFCLATGLDSENVKTNFFGKKIADQSIYAKIGLGAISDFCQIPYSLDEGVIRMHLIKGAYLGETKLADGSVVYGAAIMKSLLRNCESLPRLVNNLFSLPHLQNLKWHGTPILQSTPKSVGEGSCIRIGDAAGYVEPFTGQGMTWAIQSAVLAADLITDELENSSGLLAVRWKKVLRSKLYYSKGLCKFTSLFASFPSYTFPILRSGFFPEKILLQMLYGKS